MRVWWVVPWDRKLKLRMYRSSELSRTTKEPSGLPDNFASASSHVRGPQYQPTCKVKEHIFFVLDFLISNDKSYVFEFVETCDEVRVRVRSMDAAFVWWRHGWIKRWRQRGRGGACWTVVIYGWKQKCVLYYNDKRFAALKMLQLKMLECYNMYCTWSNSNHGAFKGQVKVHFYLTLEKPSVF